MNLLAIDTATEKFSVALASDKDGASPGSVWLFEADAGLRHSELVMDSIDMLMNKAGLKAADLSGVVCMGGPGSFTGLRIGFSLAKGLALPLGIPFTAIPTLDCLSRPLRAWPGIVVPVLDAKKGAYFCALYRGGKRLCPDMDTGPAEIARAIAAQPPEQTLLIGPAASMLYEQLTIPNVIPGTELRYGNAETLLLMARETDVSQWNTDYAAGPAYIRESDAELVFCKIQITTL